MATPTEDGCRILHTPPYIAEYTLQRCGGDAIERCLSPFHLFDLGFELEFV